MRLRPNVLRALIASASLAGLIVVSPRPVAADCISPPASVDLAVEQIVYREDDLGQASVSYMIRNLGTIPSTSYEVRLSVDGDATRQSHGYHRGLAPGRTLRWAFELPNAELAQGEHELSVQVETALPGSPAWNAYGDRCADNDRAGARIRRI